MFKYGRSCLIHLDLCVIGVPRQDPIGYARRIGDACSILAIMQAISTNGYHPLPFFRYRVAHLLQCALAMSMAANPRRGSCRSWGTLTA